jgi:hypothetical protein
MAVRLPLGWGTVGGSGGMIPGLMAVKLPFELVPVIGSERDAAWLETARPKVIVRTATDAVRRALNSFEVIRVHLLGVKRGTKSVAQTGENIYNKSSIEVNLFQAYAPFSIDQHGPPGCQFHPGKCLQIPEMPSGPLAAWPGRLLRFFQDITHANRG